MADDDFLKEPETPEETEKQEEPEKIKIGEREFTQEELNRRIGLSDVAIESEEKYDRPISKYWPEYTKSQQRIKELEEKLQGAEQTTSAPTAGSPEEVKTQALKQAKELGLITVDDINNYIDARVEGYKLREDVDALIDESKKDGKPVPTETELLNYMAENGIRNPDKAYKLMFEDELDSWKEKKLKSIKTEGLKTQETSTAGETKIPEVKVPANLDDLRTQLRSFMKRQEGSENA